MMNRLEQTREQLAGRTGLIAYLTAGDPDYAGSLEALNTLAESGADVIELGMPFSDSTADGPVIQAAHLRALATGQSVEKTLRLVADFRCRNRAVPVVLMGYCNPIWQYGPERFCGDLAAAGGDGVLVLDLPFEHGHELREHCRRHGLCYPQMVTPGTNEARLAGIDAHASGFLYLVSGDGVTGNRSLDFESIRARLAQVRVGTRLPLALGFGLREAMQLAQVAGLADWAVVGSALVETLQGGGNLAAKVRELKSALDRDMAVST